MARNPSKTLFICYISLLLTVKGMNKVLSIIRNYQSWKNSETGSRTECKIWDAAGCPVLMRYKTELNLEMEFGKKKLKSRSCWFYNRKLLLYHCFSILLVSKYIYKHWYYESLHMLMLANLQEKEWASLWFVRKKNQRKMLIYSREVR